LALLPDGSGGRRAGRGRLVSKSAAAARFGCAQERIPAGLLAGLILLGLILAGIAVIVAIRLRAGRRRIRRTLRRIRATARRRIARLHAAARSAQQLAEVGASPEDWRTKSRIHFPRSTQPAATAGGP